MPTVQVHQSNARDVATIVGFVLMVVLYVGPAIADTQGRGAEDEAKRIVILNSTDPYLPAFLVLDDALRETIHTDSRMPVEFYAEALDMHRFPRAQFDHELVALLRKKYADLKVDVVVADAAIALDFAQRHRSDIWPGAVIAFNSVPTDALRGGSLESRTIGLPVQLEFGQTLVLALKLRPATRRLVVVAGAADPDQRHLSLVKKSLERYAGKFEVQYLDGLGLAQTLAAVHLLTSDAVVLYVTMFRDGDGMPYVPREVLNQIAAVSAAPVFGVFETYLGHGIAAGSIVSFGEQGRRTGELVARVLNGEDPSTIGVQAPVEAACIADSRQLRHWGIDESLLPADCTIRGKEVTVWDRYHWQILTTMTVILAQAVLIVVLILHRRRLRQTQDALHGEYERRRIAEMAVLRVRKKLSRFSKQSSLGVMATAIAHEINQPLIAIQNYVLAARQRLRGGTEQSAKLAELLEKASQQAGRVGDIIQRIRNLVTSNMPEVHPVSVQSIVEQAVRIMEPEIESRGCVVKVRLSEDLPPILADELQIQLVLVNLLRNALRAVKNRENTADRIIRIQACRISDREVQVEVVDREPGIPPERVADIFEPLYTDKRDGMGMGLAICRLIIDTHGGGIRYEPNPSGGAILSFTLRVAKDRRV